jgi:hypothetical protein
MISASPITQFRPLSDTNPELFILESPGIWEYRIENWRLSHGAHNFDWQDISIVVAFLYLEVLGMIYHDDESRYDNLHRFKAHLGHLVHSECWQCYVYVSGVLKCYLVRLAGVVCRIR